MSSTIYNISFDCADPYELSGFWAEALDRSRHPEDQPGADETVLLPADGVGPQVYFQRVPEGRSAKNRLHICLQPTDRARDAEVERLLGLGATHVADHREPDGTGWAVLADPEGNEFCVLRSAAERR
ncbi:VOC family protein [Plantactinospora sp. S1510]|uniref:VOC family protein n=1 Tax=Plantactinospora alkalitolerans TaxID=2789879 RepID=A0ABS0GQC0_9ACTN|nr:VOC family protein [Plantactinospora alkalitolerans]MBF9128380.1 VOC family protein [Plantactinospora alkalitolerans]